MKQCSKCSVDKPLSEFHKDKSKSDGRRSDCKVCACKRVRGYHSRQDPIKVSGRRRRWREENSEKARQYRQRYYGENKEAALEYQRRWNKQNPDKIRESRQRYNRKNAKRRSEYHRQWREENREETLLRMKRWREANPEKVKIGRQLRRGWEENADGTCTAEQWEARLMYHGANTCYYCKCRTDDIHCEHRIPLSRGGTNWPANLVPACPTCNLSKGTKTEKEFLDTADS